MSTKLLRLWLPISLVVHLVVIFAMKFVPLQAAIVEGATKVSLVALPDVVKPTPTPEPPEKKIQERKIVPPTRPLEVPQIQPKPQQLRVTQPPIQRGKVKQLGVRKPQQFQAGQGQGAPGPIIPRKNIGIVGPGQGKSRTPAPSVTKGNNPQTVADSHSDGAGTAPDGAKGKEVEGGGSGNGGGETYGAQATYKAAASYPKDALNANAEGAVVVIVSIDTEGRVVSADVSVSSGSAALDRAALKAARRCRYKPAKVRGELTSSTDRMTYSFKDGCVTHD